MKILYFAWLRTKTGKSSEVVAPPATVDTVDALVTWLKQQGDEYVQAFANMPSIRAAVNQTYVQFDHAIRPDDEIAFFPPVTGG